MRCSSTRCQAKNAPGTKVKESDPNPIAATAIAPTLNSIPVRFPRIADENYMKFNCAKTCGMCQTGSLGASSGGADSECKDKNDQCALWKDAMPNKSCTGHEDETYMKKNCPKTCGLCSGGGSGGGSGGAEPVYDPEDKNADHTTVPYTPSV